jgi:glyoxylase-like metal-dependent hydrolase (beta-lactamase superfamily II)
MILEGLVVGPIGTNCYIVGSESTKKGMVIDPGGDPENIVNAINELKLSIAIIVVTHTHFDHIGALKALKDATGAQIALHHDEEAGDNMMPGSFAEQPKADRLLKDGDVIELDDLHFTVLDTPGHSPGGISIAGHGIVFSGDTLFNCGIGRTDFPGCSQAKLMDSINNKLMTLPDETQVFPGHGPQTTIGAEKKMNPFL